MYLAIWRGRLRIVQYIIPHARALPANANPFHRTPPLIVRQREKEKEGGRQGLIYERRRERARSLACSTAPSDSPKSQFVSGAGT